MSLPDVSDKDLYYITFLGIFVVKVNSVDLGQPVQQLQGKPVGLADARQGDNYGHRCKGLE